MANLAIVDSVSFRYPGLDAPALVAVDWKIAEGSFVLVAGPSGSGKSTLLRCLNGLVPHFSGGRFGGNVVVAGKNTRRFGPCELATTVGFVFQDPEAQLVTPRVEDELAFGLEQQGITQRVMRIRIEEALDLLGIAGLRYRDVATLSGGERQRVAIASVLALHPRLLVLDEPTSQLDPWAAEEVAAALTRLNADLGLTVVVAEHRLERLAAHADSMRFTLRPDLHLDGDPREILASSGIAPHLAPQIVQLGRALGWDPLPMTVREGRDAARGLDLPKIALRAVQIQTGESLIQTRRLSLGHETANETIETLAGIDLAMYPGELVALMGRNGAGKTTLLRAIAGAHPRVGGEILYGNPSSGAHANEATPDIVAYLPQNPGSILHRETVREEIDATINGRRRRGLGRDPAPDTDELIHRLGLRPLMDRHPRDLSGGERQRVAIAAILAGGARALLLDEPTRGMDGEQKYALGRLLTELASAGLLVVLATHDVELVAMTATRVIMLGGGEIVADGPPRDVLSGALTYGTQVNKIFGDHYMTVAEALNAADPPVRP